MKLSDFNLLPLQHKFDVVCKWGFLIFRKSIGRCNIALVSVGDFFAVITIDKVISEVLSINSYSIESLPVHYYQMIEGENAFKADTSVTARNFRDVVVSANCLNEVLD